MSVSKRVRFDVFKRDLFTCQYCGKRPPEVILEVDHVIPKVEGGVDDPANLTTACLACNRGKGGVPLVNMAPALNELEVLAGIQEMLERAVNLRESTKVAEKQRAAEDEVIDTFRSWWQTSIDDGGMIVDASLRNYLRDLSPAELRHAIDVLESRMEWRDRPLNRLERWKYFCGICRGKILDKRGE